jgi:anti-anti-sigma regulatory factor
MSNQDDLVMIETVTLPERLGFDASRDLHRLLVQHRGVPIRIDGSNVTSAGTLATQVLLAAARAWRADGTDFIVVASPGLQQDLELLGVSSEFAHEEAN